MRMQKICQECEKIFLIYNYRKNTAKFCSRRCYHNSDYKRRIFRDLALNRFSKGMPDNTRLKLSLAHKGKHNLNSGFKKGQFLGEKHPLYVNIPKEKLVRLYIEEEKSIQEISRELHNSPNTISRRLKLHNIKIRSNSLSLLLKFKNGRPKFSPEHRKKISLSHKGLKGQMMSIKTKKKLSIAKKELMKNRPELLIALKNARKIQVLPKKDTSIEVKIQGYLKRLGIEFFTHQYIKEIEHGYQCDILIPSMNLVIECDGNYWHKYPVGNDIDHIRTKELIEKGFRVLRLWENEIRIMDINKFKEKLKDIS